MQALERLQGTTISDEFLSGSVERILNFYC